MSESIRLDDDLHAWADGQLGEDRRRRFEDDMAVDPALATRAAGIAQQNAWLRRNLDTVLDEPLPQRLIDAARGPAAEVTRGPHADVGVRSRPFTATGSSQDAAPARRAPNAGRVARLAEAWRHGAPWMRWALAAQLATIAVLGVVVADIRPPAAAYRTLGSAGAAADTGRIVVVFDPGITEADMRRILRIAGARVVDGPTSGNAYVLALAPERMTSALAMFGSQHSVLFAAPFGPLPKP